MKYKIISDWNRSDLEDEVNNWIGDGWKPQGGVSVAMTDNYEEDQLGTEYCQAMIKEGS